ncbi:UDP-2,4-diacetamido-2,4,6-trideoxy-beta-L-altropyranose hydrolase [Lysinibacillus fusiformis]|uniref:UDP-2,4-diacetamido-2,4, 6-trideoxy-beta-L-altropyranose hydrolase n=1 Tax=Lysinibacillus fusiformis TaxID=28031 RepID=UPI0023AA05A1|nr:UDP-2,4-diacetamido-2,4,6-trideoxy-beta-L-altropyranose hydrolase [Lysinibacillus fusiformis]WEA39921.1 UDP-2,4-diacetamido-2,4,6-trideoxy-beta-L-altropyranose hydrolase [Lysinibacillus fusiformis]
MDTIIRVDASVEIGTGHVMRCLTLAHKLKKDGQQVAFICRGAMGECITLIEQQGFVVYNLPPCDGSLWNFVAEYWEKDAYETIEILKQYAVKKLIIDHYSIDIKWEQLVRPFVKSIMVIDDLANRNHDCDILLDQNFYLDMDTRYNGLVPSSTKMLLGPSHALLRDEFIEARNHIKPFNGRVERLFIFFGGSDPTNETEKVLLAIKSIIDQYKIVVDVVVGNSNPNKLKIKQLCDEIENTHYHCQVNNIAELMAQADLAIGGGGSTTWERIFLKLPTLVIAVAENQVEIAKATHIKGACIYLGLSKKILINDIQNSVDKTLKSNMTIYNMISNMRFSI